MKEHNADISVSISSSMPRSCLLGLSCRSHSACGSLAQLCSLNGTLTPLLGCTRVQPCAVESRTPRHPLTREHPPLLASKPLVKAEQHVAVGVRPLGSNRIRAGHTLRSLRGVPLPTRLPHGRRCRTHARSHPPDDSPDLSYVMSVITTVGGLSAYKTRASAAGVSSRPAVTKTWLRWPI